MRPELVEPYAQLERWHWWFRGRARVIEAVLLHELGTGPARRVLSAGCGPATGLAWLAPFAGPRGCLIGLDVDGTHARGKPAAIEFVQGRLERAPFADASFDVVLALDVLEHLDDDSAGLRGAVRLLRPDGFLLVTVPALPSLWGAQDTVSEHRRRYTRRSLRRLFAQVAPSGYRIRYFNTLLFPAVGAVRWSRRVLGGAGRARSDFDDNRPGLVNELLARVFGLERHLINRAAVPVGVSLMATYRAPRASTDVPTAG